MIAARLYFGSMISTEKLRMESSTCARQEANCSTAAAEHASRPWLFPLFFRPVIIAAILPFLFPACSRKKDDAPTETTSFAVEKTFERGPLKIILRVDNDEPTIADRIQLQLEVICKENYEVEWPRFGEKLEQFGIIDYSTSPLELVGDGQTRQIRSYVLEPFLSGEYVIPPMTFTFREKTAPASEDADAAGTGAVDGDETHQLETEDVKIQVRSLLAEDRADLEIHEIAPPVEVPQPDRSRLWWTIGGSTAAAIGLAFLAGWWWRRRQPHRYQPPPIPAHELAFQQLEALVAEDLPAKGEIKQFYQRISDIVRHYIENRFGLHAPEQTTEEFLGEMRTTNALSAAHKPLLKTFLEHCDLVKFANHQPDTGDIQRTFDACKKFIVETRQAAIETQSEAAPASPPSTSNAVSTV